MTASTGATSEARPANGAAPEDSSLAELLSELTGEATQLLRQEVELAKAEVREEATRAAKGSVMLGAAAVVGHMALLLLSFALAWALAAVLPAGLAFLLVAVLYAAAAGLLYVTGRQRLQNVQPTPEQTLESVKEDAAWARDRTR